MKVERSSAARGGQRAAALYARQAAVATAPLSALATSASVLGIPEAEFTTRVRDAIMMLMGEVDGLRHEVGSLQRRLEEAEKSADLDQLLPVLNRRAFVRELTRHISLAGRYGTPTSLIYFDLNEFSAVNDTYGHPAGDAVLEHFAEVLLSNVRESDVVGRLGGDEFGVLLTHATEEQAHRKADLLAERLRIAPPEWNGVPLAVSFAYGAFQLKPGDDAGSAMARADAAMYAHKRASR